MQWLASWLGNRPQLSPLLQKRLSAWQNMPSTSSTTLLDNARRVVVDVETSGLNLSKDHLLSIGAVAVVNGRIVFGDSFYVVLQQPTVSRKENILVHGIGGTDQTDGVPAAEALLAFLEYLRKDPLIAFHAFFDKAMIRRAMRQYLGFSFKHLWVDMAYVMPALNPALATQHQSLDDWIAHFDIRNDARHNAMSDALVTAQLFQVALAQAKVKNITDLDGMHGLEKVQRWLKRVS